MAARMGKGTPRLALFGEDRVSGGRHRDGSAVCLVDHAQRSARRTCQSQPDNESIESAVVLPRLAGDAGLLRSLDRRRSDAVDHHDRIDGISLCGFQSAG